MGKPERNFWEWLDTAVGNGWDAQRHEDKYSVGIPDVSFGALGVNGWIELKACKKWPTNGLPKFTTKQAGWLSSRGNMGGNCFILARIDFTILLFHWKDSFRLTEGNNTNETILRDMALMVWDKEFSRIIFINEVTRNERSCG